MTPRALDGCTLYLDCFSGMAGDMFLGAMIDLGLPEERVRDAISALNLDNVELVVGRKSWMGIVACDVKVHVDGRPVGWSGVSDSHHDHNHHHEHDHTEHEHRTFRSIRTQLEHANLEKGVRARALDIFQRLALAESRMHGISIEEVSFHEVGALDALVDVVGAAVALEWVSPLHVVSRPVAVGEGGFVRCAHGVLPVPSPATLAILERSEICGGGVEAELCTPTGAAIVAHAVDRFGPLPAGELLRVGYGSGDMELADRPNHLRLMAIGSRSTTAAESESCAELIEANVDDMSAEIVAYVVESLLAAGARDAWCTPIVMKKGRSAVTIAALCEGDSSRVRETLLRESTSFGLRRTMLKRDVVERRFVNVTTPFGAIPVKQGFWRGARVVAAPEYDACCDAAQKHQVPLKEVFASAMSAFRQQYGE